MTSPTVNGATRGRALSVIVHADTKVGKSTLVATAPKPMVLLDAEAAYRFLDVRRVMWNPNTEGPPEPDGTWDVAVVVVNEYATLTRAVDWLKSGQHKFRSAGLDSISEIQKRLKDSLKTLDEQMDQRKWGQLLDHMERLCRDLRDLTEHPTTPLEAVVLTAMTENRDSKWRPYVQGALRTTMPYFMDVIGYMYVQEIMNEDPTQPSTKMRRMLVSPDAQFEAGERVRGRLGTVVDNPNISTMLDMVFGTAAATEGGESHAAAAASAAL